MPRVRAEYDGVVKSLTLEQRRMARLVFNKMCRVLDDPYLAFDETLDSDPFILMSDAELKPYAEYLKVRLISKTSVSKGSMLSLIGGCRRD